MHYKMKENYVTVAWEEYNHKSNTKNE